MVVGNSQGKAGAALGTVDTLDPGKVFLTYFTPAVGCRLVKWSALIDTDAPGTQRLVAVIWNGDDDELVAQSSEIMVTDSGQRSRSVDDAYWVDLSFLDEFAGGFPLLGGTEYGFGLASLHVEDLPVAGVWVTPQLGTDTTVYDPAGDLSGPLTPDLDATMTDVIALGYATCFTDYVPRHDVTAFDLARLPFELAQQQLETVERGDAVLTTLGWHGTDIDPRCIDASFAVVKAGGPLAGNVGERVRISSRRGSRGPVFAYIVAESADIPDPITVTRRAFQEFDHLTADDVPVVVEVLL